ncbi:hypothetical protein DNTS_015541 [Danionella cerebrum]|uniref:BRCA1-associated protein n=1 Tax=Danionella cerebrum TaxID=2873325 RepID=A0A553MLD4_9TELE|nr:hypothetical protein DNTS_015541 [Danionella translucida]
MSVSLVVIRLELADQSESPLGFHYNAVWCGWHSHQNGPELSSSLCVGLLSGSSLCQLFFHISPLCPSVSEMSDDQMREKVLGSARVTLEGKTELERAGILHQHLGSRVMSDMVIETFQPSAGTTGAKEEEKSPMELSGDGKELVETGVTPDSPSKQLPDQISFFSGNPKMTSLTEDVRRSAMLCILTVPTTMTSHDLMKFVAPFNDVMEHMKIIRDSTPNQYMVLVKFRSQADADSFYTTCNGRQFNSIEDAVCQLVYVERAEVIKSEEGASLPVMELTELPKCTVCLERMDESVNGVLTTLCNHSFHSQCLQRWEDASCPVCRYCQTPEPVEENKCFECGVHENLWICLICGHIGCGRYVSRHAYKHFEETQHTYAMQLTNHRVWDYAGDNYVHRLVASKTDGKMVQYECEGDTCQEDKIDALQLEYSYLLTSQLESQRIYWENKIVHLEKDTAEEINNMKAKFKETIEKCTQLNTKVAKLSLELREEQEMNRCLRANQTHLQTQLQEEGRRLQEMAANKDGNIAELQEQLRDVMFYLETQQQIERMPAEARQEIQEGQINMAAAAAGPSQPAHNSGKLGSRKGRAKRGK